MECTYSNYLKTGEDDTMGLEKIEKKLAEDIVSLIDLEAAKQAVSRQEIISRLARVVITDRNETDIELLKTELKTIRQHLALKEDEVSYLRGELSTIHRGLSKLAENLVSRNPEIHDWESRLLSLEDKITDLSGFVTGIRQQIEDEVSEKKSSALVERQILLIIIGILTGLLGLFLILTRT